MKLPEYELVKQTQSADNHSISLKLQLTADLDFFDGHFEQMAILPAVAQLFMVKKFADRYLSVTGHFVGLRQLKFKAPITPLTDTEVLIEYRIEQGKLLFTYTSLGQIKSKGVFLFEQAVQP